jgi:hypothetical protein
MPENKCVLCGGDAERTKPHPDRNYYEFDCSSCGQYGTGLSGTEFWPSAPLTERTAHIAFIKRENKRGHRPLI